MEHRRQHVRGRSDAGPGTRMSRTHPRISNAALARVMRGVGPATREGGPLDRSVASDIDRARGGGDTLPVGLRSSWSEATGADLTGVRVHRGAEAHRLNQAVGARAFTVGSDIFFSDGAYDPSSGDGQELIAHEVTHVVQQAGASGTPQAVAAVDHAAEVEARQVARLLAQAAPTAVGNRSVARCAAGVHRDPTQASPPSDLVTLGEMLTRWNVPEDEVIALITAMSATDRTVVALVPAYRALLADALSFDEMVQVVRVLPLTLEQRLGWLRDAAVLVRAIGYDEIRPDVVAAPQAERDALKNGWRDFFVTVCDNATMVTALDDLGFDLVTKLTWLDAEMTWTGAELSYATVRPWVQAAPQAERDALRTGWLEFFAAVCDNTTMVTALDDLGFDLETRLTWLDAEMTWTRAELSYATVRPWVQAAPQAERDALRTPGWLDFFGRVCDNATMETAVTDLGFPLPVKLRWMLDEGADYAALKRVIVAAPDTAVALADRALLLTMHDELAWDDFARCVELLGRAIPGPAAMLADANVQAALTSAWAASNAALTSPPPAPPTPGVHEEGGFVYLDLVTGDMSTSRVPPGAQASLPLNDPEPPDHAVTVGGFHTHPNVGPAWGAPFASGADQRWANRNGIPLLIRGAFPTVAATSDTSVGAARRHLAGDRGFPGASGGTPPQAPLDGDHDDDV